MWPHSFKFKTLDPHAAYLEDSLLSSQSTRLLIHPSLSCPWDPFQWASPQVKGRVGKVAGAGILFLAAPLLKVRGRFFRGQNRHSARSVVGSASSELKREWGWVITAVSATTHVAAQPGGFPSFCTSALDPISRTAIYPMVCPESLGSWVSLFPMPGCPPQIPVPSSFTSQNTCIPAEL